MIVIYIPCYGQKDRYDDVLVTKMSLNSTQIVETLLQYTNKTFYSCKKKVLHGPSHTHKSIRVWSLIRC